jgi:predicted CoA-substrate-specific enzyme activase
MITAGVDIGSLTAKAVILRDNDILSYTIFPTEIDTTRLAEHVLDTALEKARLEREDLAALVATGYGRAKVPLASKSVTEITCDAKGAHFIHPQTRMLIDIGGQDSKVISLDQAGRVVDFVMNDKCAAGTGRFLEVMAQALGVELAELGPVSLKYQKPLVISSMCTVFAESEVISLIAEGYPKEDIVNGLHQAISSRVSAMAHSLRIEDVVMLGGGVAKNIGVVQALEQKVKHKLIVPPEPQVIAALGAAICARESVTG